MKYTYPENPANEQEVSAVEYFHIIARLMLLGCIISVTTWMLGPWLGESWLIGLLAVEWVSILGLSAIFFMDAFAQFASTPHGSFKLHQ